MQIGVNAVENPDIWLIAFIFVLGFLASIIITGIFAYVILKWLGTRGPSAAIAKRLEANELEVAKLETRLTTIESQIAALSNRVESSSLK